MATLCLAPYAYSQPLAVGSGFVVHARGVDVLITNYHVLSGKHPATGKQLGDAVPDRVLLPLLSRHFTELSWFPSVQRLLSEDGQPLWVEHPTLGRAVDIAALPLHVPPNALIVPYPLEPGPELDLPPASDLAIIGFPEGVTGGGITAIWKAGTIASEPDLPGGGADYFWIDSNTRPGMSGSPVVARRFGAAMMKGGDYNLGQRVIDRSVGVYSGRAYDAPDMTLGRVWRWARVQDVVRAAVSRVQRGVISSQPCRLGHFHLKEENMVTVEIKKTVELPVVDAQGNQSKKSLTLAGLLRDMALADLRFGENLESVRTAARIDAALAEAEEGDGNLELTDDDFAKLRECLENPSKPYNPVVARLALPLIDHFLEAGGSQD